MRSFAKTEGITIYLRCNAFDAGLRRRFAGLTVLCAYTRPMVDVRVRWIDHKCKVNCDEFDREESYLRVRRL